MLVCVTATVVLAFGTTMFLMAAEDASLESRLSGAGRAARADVETGRIPGDIAGFDELLLAERQVYGERGALDRPLLGAVALAAIVFGGMIAIFLAARLGRQLEAISIAADRVASGDLTARAALVGGAAGETLILAENFNRMAAALASYQVQTIEAAAAIAHELRTPLAILLGRLQGMREGIFPKDRDDIGALIRQVEALGKIVDDLAFVSLASAGRLAIATEAIDLAAVVATLLDDLGPKLAQAGLAIERELPSAMASADPLRIRQATLALIDNVVGHAGGGGVIRLETASTDGWALLRVLDRGPGIAVSEGAILFEPFYRHDTSRSRAHGGTGLGLSVVAAIAAAHGGSVVAAPRLGGGAAFTLTVPSSRGGQ